MNYIRNYLKVNPMRLTKWKSENIRIIFNILLFLIFQY